MQLFILTTACLSQFHSCCCCGVGLDLFGFIGNVLFRFQGPMACGFVYVNIFLLCLLWFDLVDQLPEMDF